MKEILWGIWHETSWRAVWLILVAGVIFHLSEAGEAAVLVGYVVCEQLEHWQKRQRIEYDVDGWEQDVEDPEYENKGNLARRRLTGETQFLWYTVGGLLRNVP
jgi:hypothetical protein